MLDNLTKAIYCCLIMDKLLTIKEAADLQGVSTSTMRRWESEGRLLPDERTQGNQRLYRTSSIRPEMTRKDDSKKRTIAYARVSSHDQKEYLAKDVLEIITVFSARLYGILSHKNKKLINNMKKAVESASRS